MTPADYRKQIVSIAKKQLWAEGYELANRTTTLPELGTDEFTHPEPTIHRPPITITVHVVCASPLAATVTICIKSLNGEVQFERPLIVYPADAEVKVKSAIAATLTRNGEVSLSRILSLTPIQSSLLEYLKPKELAQLLATSQSLRAALSTKKVDMTFWKGHLKKDFEGETVEDATSSTAYRRAYNKAANKKKEEKARRVGGRMAVSPDLLDDQHDFFRPNFPQNPYGGGGIGPFGPPGGGRIDPDNPTGPFGYDPSGGMPFMRDPMGGGFLPRGDPRNPFGPNPGEMMPRQPQHPRGGFNQHGGIGRFNHHGGGGGFI